MISSRALLSLSTLALLGLSLFGQTDSGKISGLVTDPSGSVVPNATVVVKNDNTGVERKATANEAGIYFVGQLSPAPYSLSATAPGLTSSLMKGVAVQVGKETTVNLTLQPAQIATTVDVSSGELTQIDTSSADVGVNVSQREVANLPLNGRQISQLYLLTPGAVNIGGGTFDDIHFSGRSLEQNVIRYDGVEGTSIVDSSPGNINGEVPSAFRLQSSLENVQEFRVESNNFPAEYGTGTGGQISVITKSGGNQLHGAAFEYLRNDALDARNFFDSGLGKSKLRLNQFGGSLGGPIQKDKLFFFGSVETLKQRTGVPIIEGTLSDAARAQAVASIQPLLKAFPKGQVHSSDPLIDIAQVTGIGTVDEFYGGARFDYNFSDKYKFYGRYFRDQGYAYNWANSTGSASYVTAVPQNAVLSLQQLYSARIINETKVGLNPNKTRINGIPPIPELNGAVLNPTGSVALSGVAGQSGSAGLAIPTGLVRSNSAQNGRGQPYTNYSLSFIDNLNITQGAHDFKFGVEVRPIYLQTDRQGGTTYAFANVAALLANQPSSIQYLGDTSSLSPWTGKSGLSKLHQNYYIAYAQDEWKLNPEITVNYGLRYEYYSPLHEKNNKDVYFQALTGTFIPGFSGDWYQSSKTNFAPRLGISYAPKALGNKTVFRIGGGYYFGPGQTEDQLQPAESDRISTTISSGPLNVYPLNIPALVATYDINNPNLGYQPRAYAPGYKIPEKVLQYTASVQQELPGHAVVTVAYVGSQGRNLFLRSITNKITGVATNPATGAAMITREFGNRFAEIDYKTSGGTDNYNALQTQLSRRFAQGLSIAGQLSWARSIGNTSGSNEARTAADNYNFAADRGDNNFDVRVSGSANALYELPFAKGNKLFGGWQVGGVYNARTGVPIEVNITRPDVVYRVNSTGQLSANPVVSNGAVLTTAIINTPGGGNSRNVRRPDLVAGINPYANNGLSFINPAAFAIPQAGTFGNLARNALHGPNLNQFDLTLDKSFHITERSLIQFRAEFYNLFNHANFATPGNARLAQSLPNLAANATTISAVAAGQVVGSGIQPGQAFTAATAGGGFGNLTSTLQNQVGIGTQRQIQFALRLQF